MVSNKVFCLAPSQDEEKMETGPEGSSSGTAETMVYYFHVFFFGIESKTAYLANKR